MPVFVARLGSLLPFLSYLLKEGHIKDILEDKKYIEKQSEFLINSSENMASWYKKHASGRLVL